MNNITNVLRVLLGIKDQVQRERKEIVGSQQSKLTDERATNWECRVRRFISGQSSCKWIGHHEKARGVITAAARPQRSQSRKRGNDLIHGLSICLLLLPSGDGSLSHTAHHLSPYIYRMSQEEE
eukprot:superscaffoldBa00004272_g18571